MAYSQDSKCVALFHALGRHGYQDKGHSFLARLRASIHRYSIDRGILCYCKIVTDTYRVVVPHDDNLMYLIFFEAHVVALSGNLSCEKTYGFASQHYGWPILYKWVGTYVRTRETCHRVKISAHSVLPLDTLPVPTGCRNSISMYLVWYS